MSSRSEWALTYARNGWPVLPVAPGGKQPLPGSRGFKEATTDPERIKAWWLEVPEANIGLAIPEGYFVLDLDGPEAGPALRALDLDTPTTTTQKTPRGLHLIYRCSEPLRQTTGEIAKGVDTKAAGSGYIVAAPSQVGGSVYQWQNGFGAVVDAPDWIYECLAANRPSEEATSSSAAEQLIAEGTRNTALTRMAGAMRRPGFCEAAIVAALLEHNRTHCATPLPDTEVRRIAKSVSRYEPAPKGLPQGSTISANQLLALDLPEPVAVVDGLVYEGLSLLAGKPKLGKSFLALNLALAVAGGTRFLDGLDCEQGNVLFLALEDGKRRLRKRIAGLLGGENAPRGLRFATEWPRLDEGGLERLSAELQTDPGIRLVIVDTLARVRTIKSGRGSHYNLDYNAISGLQDLANRYNRAVVTITHTREAPAEDFLDKVSGTAGLTGAADAVLVLTRSRGKADAELSLVGRDFDERELALDFDKSTGGWTLLGDGVEYRLSKERREIVDFLRGLDGESAWPSEIAQGIGKPEKVGSIKGLLAKLLKEDGLISKERRGYFVPLRPQ